MERSMASDTYHEPQEQLSERTRDLHRAISSLMEELEAIDWYQQRADVTKDPELRAVLEHNRDEETEHAMMVLEWLRRASSVFDVNVRTYLMKEGPITSIEASEKNEGAEAKPVGAVGSSEPSFGPGGSLGLGSLKAASLEAVVPATGEGG
jgi:ferritin-like protein